MRKDISHRPGVTLIELLIVVSVMAILIIATLFYVRSSMPKARDGERKADLKKISTALEQYRSDHGGYPAGMVPNPPNPTPLFLSGCGPNTVLEPYLSDVPCDPETDQPYGYNPRGNSFTGRKNAVVFREYRLLTRLEYEQDPIIAELCPRVPLPNHCGGQVRPTSGPTMITVGTCGSCVLLNYGVSAGVAVNQ